MGHHVMVVGEVTDKSHLIGNDLCHFYLDFQDHEVRLVLRVGVGLEVELSTKSHCL